MASAEEADISRLMAAWSQGDEAALRSLVSEVYPEIRRLARQHLGRRSLDHTLESAGLANEAFLRLARARGIRCESRVHFFALCAQVIRRIAVDHSRNRKYAKRGGGVPHLPLEPVAVKPRGVAVDALDEALTALAKLDPRKRDQGKNPPVLPQRPESRPQTKDGRRGGQDARRTKEDESHTEQATSVKWKQKTAASPAVF